MGPSTEHWATPATTRHIKEISHHWLFKKNYTNKK